MWKQLKSGEKVKWEKKEIKGGKEEGRRQRK